MLSFYQKLASKLNDADVGAAQAAPAAAPGVKSVSLKATGERVDASQKPNAGAAGAATHAEEPAPEGTEPLNVDLYQSEDRTVIFAQMPGVSKNDFEIVADEESNTLTIQATQKRPAMPPTPGVKEKSDEEKGRFLKQENKWKSLYRKVYLPAPFDSGEAGAFLDRGVLVIILPAKKPGAGKKLAVKEILEETREAQPEK